MTTRGDCAYDRQGSCDWTGGIRRFGRFPHRNAVLGRTSTAEEQAHLAQSDRHFGHASAADDSRS
jgi:hypothetical protein